MSTCRFSGGVARWATVPDADSSRTDDESRSIAVKQKTRFAASITGIGAVALLGIPTPALADPMKPLAPACTEWGFPGEWTIKQSNGYHLTFVSTGPVAGGDARALGANGNQMRGSVTGGIQGSNVEFTVVWIDGGSGTGTYNGVVDDNGIAHGSTFHVSDAPNLASWDSVNSLACITTAAAPDPVPGPGSPAYRPPSADATVVAPAPQQVPPPAATATVVGEDVDVYDGINYPPGAANFLGILREGSQVELVGDCKPEDWCAVKGAAVPTGQGTIWGHLQF